MMVLIAIFLLSIFATNVNAQVITNPSPQIKVLCQGGSAQSVTGSTSETNLLSCAVPANSLGANGAIRIDLIWSLSNTANNKTMKVRFSTTSGDTSDGMVALSSVSTSSPGAHLITTIHNAGSTSAQVSSLSGGVGAVTAQTGSVDTTGVTYVNINATLANATDSASLVGWTVERITNN